METNRETGGIQGRGGGIGGFGLGVKGERVEEESVDPSGDNALLFS